MFLDEASIDIHAGDGTYHMLKGKGVPTISIHHGGIYPGDRELQSLDGTRREVVDADNDAYAWNQNFNNGNQNNNHTNNQLRARAVRR